MAKAKNTTAKPGPFEKRGGYSAPKGSIAKMKPPPKGPALGAKPNGKKNSS